MGLVNELFGNASEVSVEKLQEEFAPLLASNERLMKAFKLVRDVFVFTNKRIIIVDKQGLTGRKAEYMTIPYKSIERFSKESAGLLDLDAELKIWIKGEDAPLVKEFSKNSNVNEAYQVLSEYVL